MDKLIELITGPHQMVAEAREEVRELWKLQEADAELLEQIGRAVEEITAKLNHALPLLANTELRQSLQAEADYERRETRKDLKRLFG
jgi:ABC-type Fe2+-enterobactin transport system substrate-binding protein